MKDLAAYTRPKSEDGDDGYYSYEVPKSDVESSKSDRNY